MTETVWADLLGAPDDPVDAVLPAAPIEIEIDLAAIDSLRLPDTDPRRPLIGIWIQMGGGNSPDFATGGYQRNVLVFRNDGLADVMRVYGAKHTVRVVKRFDYTVRTDQRIVLGVNELYRPKFNTRTQRIPGGSGDSEIVVTPPVKPLPASVGYRIEGDALNIDGRTYHRYVPRQRSTAPVTAR